MEALLNWARTAPLWQTVPAVLVENFLLHGVAIGIGELIARAYRDRRVSEPAPPTSRWEILIAVTTLLTNSLTTLAALYLWRWGVIRVRMDVSAWALLDLALLLVVMDFAMYVLHRIAHIPWLYPWLHRPHHEYVKPRPLTLFILNPLENLSFGGLMLAVLAVYPFHAAAIGVFLSFNIASGIVGHLGVEPLPDWWARTPFVRCITGSTFHARHHQDVAANFGFYTLVWDRLFGTLRPDYWSRFGRMPAEDEGVGPVR